MSDLYDATLLSTKIPGAPRVRISSSVLEMATGQRYLSAMMSVATDDNGISTTITMPLDPCTMRTLARVLTEHATRISVELIPRCSMPCAQTPRTPQSTERWKPIMWGDDYVKPGQNPTPDTGAPGITALLIIAAIALILTCIPGVGS